jgi:hypothetical protein
MATYYVQPNGADSNTGLGPASGTAWRTVQKALGATGVTSGDTIYIAPGTYRESVTVNGTYASNVNIIGDRKASQFSGINSGYVRITGLVSDALNISTYLGNFVLNGKSYLTFDSIWFEGIVTFSANTTNVNFIRCQITMATNAPNGGTSIQIDTTGQLNILIDKCFIQGGIYVVGSGNTTNTRFNACFWQSANVSSGGIECLNSGSPRITMSNLTVFGAASQQIFRGYSPPANTLFVYNCLIVPDYASPTFGCGNTNCIVEDANVGYLTRGGGVAAGANSKQLYHRAFVGTPVYINPIDAELMPYTPLNGDVLIGAGLPAYSFGTDFYGNAWANPPSVGASEFKSFNAVSVYIPTDRNASTITIAPGSTSQSIELYLGATGLTASTSGLSARYNRTRTASVSIPLVARTIAQAWTAGGFAEVDATNMPGVYRLDIPDAALAAGADDVTIVVRGASGTNGAVMTVKLSSGGLTSAQTASAVWDAATVGYNTATNFGGVIMETNGVVNGIESTVQDIPSNVWDELKANHTIPNTFGDYLDTKVSTGADTARIQLRQGPFLIKQNAIDSVITEVNQFLSTVPNIEMVLIDSSGGSVSVAGSTLVMRVRNQAGTAVVNNITPTVAYADGGVIRWSPNLSWNALTVTTAGTYRIVVERTMSGVTTTFGPFLVQLSSG